MLLQVPSDMGEGPHTGYDVLGPQIQSGWMESDIVMTFCWTQVDSPLEQVEVRV